MHTEALQIKIFIQMETKNELSDDQFKVIIAFWTYAPFYTIDLLIFDHIPKKSTKRMDKTVFVALK